MNNKVNKLEENSFKSINEFKNCIIRGAEICFIWKNIKYGITPFADHVNICIYDDFTDVIKEYDFKTADELLDSQIGDSRLRDVITKVKVFDRTL